MEGLLMAKKKINQRMFHVPNAKNVCMDAEAKQLLNCLDKIEKAKKEGNMSCYLLAGENHYLTKDNEQRLLNAGYDLIKKYFHYDHAYFLNAIFDESATGRLIIET